MPETDAAKGKAGRTLTESYDIKQRWAEYYSELHEGDYEEQMEEIIYKTIEPASLRLKV